MLSNCDLVSNVSPLLIFCRYQMKCKSVSNVSPRYMSSVLAGCERIANTPVPFAYTLILHRTVYLFCIMLPFALVVDLHYMTPFISVLISYTFIALDALAEELEDPFGTENNDLPLDAICNAIEIDLLQMNDERDIPEKRIPDKRYQLT